MAASSNPHRAGTIGPVSTSPPADPEKLLTIWDGWERGETTPGRVIADLKLAGLPELLRQLAAGER